MDPLIQGQLIFGKGAKAIQWKNYNLFNKRCYNNWLSPCKNKTKQLNSTPTSHYIERLI